MSEMQSKRAAADHAETAGARRRFRKQAPSRESMQDDDDRNMLGTTAGFFCAIWAGHLMGERLSLALTTWSAADDRGQYHLMPGDIGAVILLATEFLFVRTLLLKYALRPAAGYMGIQGFDGRQRVAEGIGAVVWRAGSLAAAAMCAYTGRNGSGGMGAVERAFAVLRCAGSVASLVVAALEEESGHGQLASAYLELGALLAASMLDHFQLVANACLVVDLPLLVAALGDTLQTAAIRPIAKAVNIAALVFGIPWLVHTSLAMSQSSSSQHGIDNTSQIMFLRAIFCGSLVIRAYIGTRSGRPSAIQGAST